MGCKTAVKSVRDTKDALIGAVTNHFIAKNKAVTSLTPEAQACAMKTCRHVPPNDISIAHLHQNATSATEHLHALTWDIAMRR
eukprot:3537441-Ditylum_brightwellii.AAC.1